MKQMSPEHYHRQVETPCHAISNVHMEHFLEINGQDQGNLLTTKSLEHRNFNNIFCDFFYHGPLFLVVKMKKLSSN